MNIRSSIISNLWTKWRELVKHRIASGVKHWLWGKCHYAINDLLMKLEAVRSDGACMVLVADGCVLLIVWNAIHFSFVLLKLECLTIQVGQDLLKSALPRGLGIFGSVIEDLKGTKTTHGDGVAAEDVSLSSEELSTIFSQSNFPDDANNTNNLAPVDVDLDIDDIDLDDPEDIPKGGRKPNVIGVLKNQKLTSRLLSFKGKSKQRWHMEGARGVSGLVAWLNLVAMLWALSGGDGDPCYSLLLPGGLFFLDAVSFMCTGVILIFIQGIFCSSVHR
ncbi:hypothetical protein Dimus_025099 [Dionaea muscipula]